MAGTQYHINQETGMTAVCNAQPGNCPLKGSDGETTPHFADQSEAKAYAEQIMEKKAIAEGAYGGLKKTPLSTTNLKPEEKRAFDSLNNLYEAYGQDRALSFGNSFYSPDDVYARRQWKNFTEGKYEQATDSAKAKMLGTVANVLLSNLRNAKKIDPTDARYINADLQDLYKKYGQKSSLKKNERTEYIEGVEKLLAEAERSATKEAARVERKRNDKIYPHVVKHLAEQKLRHEQTNVEYVKDALGFDEDTEQSEVEKFDQFVQANSRMGGVENRFFQKSLVGDGDTVEVTTLHGNGNEVAFNMNGKGFVMRKKGQKVEIAPVA